MLTGTLRQPQGLLEGEEPIKIQLGEEKHMRKADMWDWILTRYCCIVQ